MPPPYRGLSRAKFKLPGELHRTTTSRQGASGGLNAVNGLTGNNVCLEK